MRLFFDFTNEANSLRDYHGVEFQTPQRAKEHADALARHMTKSLRGDWVGWRIEVRNAEGVRFLSMPIGAVGAILSAAAVQPADA